MIINADGLILKHFSVDSGMLKNNSKEGYVDFLADWNRLYKSISVRIRGAKKATNILQSSLDEGIEKKDMFKVWSKNKVYNLVSNNVCDYRCSIERYKKEARMLLILRQSAKRKEK